MKKITDNDILILKTFLKQKEADYIINLNLRYEMDYYYGIASQILKHEKKSNIIIEDFNIEIKNKILEYIEENGTYDDKIFYHLVEAVYNVFCKYYGPDKHN